METGAACGGVATEAAPDPPPSTPRWRGPAAAGGARGPGASRARRRSGSPRACSLSGGASSALDLPLLDSARPASARSLDGADLRARLDAFEERLGLQRRELEHEFRARLENVERQMHDAQRHQCQAIRRVQGLLEERQAKNEELAHHVVGLLERIEALDGEGRDAPAAPRPPSGGGAAVDSLRLLRLEHGLEDCTGKLASLVEQENEGRSTLQEHVVRLASVRSRVDAQGEQLRSMGDRLDRGDVLVRLEAVQASLGQQYQQQQEHAEQLEVMARRLQAHEPTGDEVVTARAELACEVERLRSEVRSLGARLLVLARGGQVRSLQRQSPYGEPEGVLGPLCGHAVKRQEQAAVVANEPVESLVQGDMQVTGKGVVGCKLEQLQEKEDSALAWAREMEVIRGGLLGADGGS